MTYQWQDDKPIYRQLQQKICALIIAGDYPEGVALPSVRQLSTDLGINHLTVAKAYHELVTDELVEKRRGLGMFVAHGACAALNKQELGKFLSDELPTFARRIALLNIPLDDVIARLTQEYTTPTQDDE